MDNEKDNSFSGKQPWHIALQKTKAVFRPPEDAVPPPGDDADRMQEDSEEEAAASR